MIEIVTRNHQKTQKYIFVLIVSMFAKKDSFCENNVDNGKPDVKEKGSNFTLKCKDSEQKKGLFYWEKDDDIWFQRKQTLIFQNIQFSDAGAYRCKYKMYINERYWKYYNKTVIVVQGYPEISFSRPQYKIAFGRDVYLTCDLEETHPPLTKVWWTKYSPAGETDIEANSNKYEERYVPNKSTSINILSVDENDAGEYKCNARNAKGENFAKAMLLTGDIPKQPTTPIVTYTVKQGGTVTLICLLQPSIPAITKVYWRKGSNGYFRDVPKNEKYSGGTVIEPNLRIKDVKPQDVLEYTCIVSNGFGKSQVAMKVELGVEPVLTKSHSVLYIRRGHAAFLNVTVTSSSPITSYRWVHQAQITNSSKYTITNYDLTIRSVYANDDGVYTFYAVNDYGKQSITITLKTGIEPVLTTSHPMLYIQTRHTGFFNVTVKSSSIITTSYWMRKDKIYPSWKYTITNYDLTIRSVYENDDGEYTFYAVNDYGKQSITITLKTGRSPTVKAAEKNYHPVRGNTVTLICDVNGSKQMHWKRLNGHRYSDINTNSKYSGQTTSSLTIRNVHAVDDGEYRCYGDNDFGSKYDTIYIASGYIPIVSTVSNYLDGEYEETISISVSIEDTHPKINVIQWYQNDIYLKNERRFSRYTVSKPNLTINRLRLQDSGTYVCKVGNDIGFGNVTITLIVWRRPTLSIRGNTDIPIGSDASFRCDVSLSNPSVQRILWRKGAVSKSEQGGLANGGKYVIKQSHYSSTLKVISVNISDADTYTCVANNNFSEGIDTIILSVGSPPIVNIRRNFYVTKVGSDVNIICDIRNVPENYKSYMFWKKGSHHFRRNYSPLYIIKSAKLDDAGVYSCHVENEYGEVNDSTELKVLSALIRGHMLQEVTVNASYKIDCDVFGGNNVIWRKNNKELQVEKQQKYNGGNVNDPSLEIRKISSLDRGNYTCETTYSNVTAKSKTIQLNVRDIPLVSLSYQITEVIIGSDTILNCSYESYPEPTMVYWKKDEKIIKLSDSSRTKYNGSSEEIPVLIIYDTTLSDSGKYICYVKNDIGTGHSKTLQLIVKEPEKNVSTTGTIVGSVLATVVAILVVIGLVVLLRRRSNNVNNRKLFQKETISNAENVELSNDGRGIRDNGIYLNVGIVSTSAAENIMLPTVPIITGDNEYYNLSEVQSSCIRVDELKQYIEKKQRKEELKTEYKSIPNVAVHPTTHAQTKENMPKNRFKTTFPYDHTRVILESNGGSDYINANYVDGFEKEKCYIACQGPIKHTVADHWKMIWQENVYQIVMLTNLVEGIKIKCEQYWPSGGKQMVLGNLIIRLNVEKERTAYVTREITIEDKKTSKKRKVTQYHFTAWPDHGTPDPLYLVLFHRHVMSDTKAGHSGPLLVHCSAGIGRTGTYIALDALLEEGRTTGFLDIFKYLKKMRYSRMNMIQTADQYVCLHYTLLEAFTMKDTKIRKDKFSQVWMSISTDNRPVNHQRLDEEFKDLQQHVREIKCLSSSMLNAKKDEITQTQHNAAMSTTNLAKNRNKDVLPMDDKRVYLVSYGKGRSDYINAIQVPSYTKFVGYITTQLPLPDTKVDFWTMIRDQSSSTIVLIINNKKEADLVYSQSEENVTIGEFNIKISARRVEENDITEATIVLSKKDDKPRTIVLFQVICKGIPDPAVLCKLADLISTRATMSNDPITVVSSDGAKNSGLFCAFTNAVSSMQIDNNADIFQLVRLLQLRRPEFFTDFEEYKRCYEALHVHLESANVYANF